MHAIILNKIIIRNLTIICFRLNNYPQIAIWGIYIVFFKCKIATYDIFS